LRSGWIHRLAGGDTPRRTGMLACALAIGTLTGCLDPMRALTLTERDQLRTDALATLMRGAADPADAICVRAVEALQDAAPRDGAPYFRELLKDEYAGVRFASLMALASLSDDQAIDRIRKMAADDPDTSVRAAAALALFRAGDASRLPDLADWLMRHDNAGVRGNVAIVLGRSGTPDAVALLRAAERTERIESVRLQILEAMTLLGDESASGKLGLIGLSSTGQKMVFALMAVAEAREPRMRKLFEDQFRMGRYPEVRLAAAYGLARLGDDAGLIYAVDQLRWARADPDSSEPPAQQVSRIRMLAARVLGALGDERALAPLRHVIQSEADHSARIAAARASLSIINRMKMGLPSLASGDERE
jgi:HEAT repeat protein